MARNQVDQTYDHAHLLKDAGLVAASAAATVGGSAKILDLGDGRVDARVIADISAIEAATDEVYRIIVQGSNSATFASTNVNLGAQQVGFSTVAGESVNSAVGRREIAFTNEVNGTRYRYLRVYTQIAGTIATGINFTAYLVKAA